MELDDLIREKFFARESKYVKYIGKGFHHGENKPEVALIQSILADDFGTAGGVSPTYIDANGELVDLFYRLDKIQLFDRIENMSSEPHFFYPDVSFKALSKLDPELGKEWKESFDDELILNYKDEKRVEAARSLGGAEILGFNHYTNG